MGGPKPIKLGPGQAGLNLLAHVVCINNACTLIHGILGDSSSQPNSRLLKYTSIYLVMILRANIATKLTLVHANYQVIYTYTHIVVPA